MTKLKTALTFKDNTVNPEYEGEHEVACVLYNKCDGYHLVYARFDCDSNEFDGFYDWASYDEYRPDFYVAWAALPSSVKMSLVFDKDYIEFLNSEDGAELRAYHGADK